MSKLIIGRELLCKSLLLHPSGNGHALRLSGVRRGHALRRWKPSSSTGLTKSNRIPIVYWVEHGDHYQKIFAARVC